MNVIKLWSIADDMANLNVLTSSAWLPEKARVQLEKFFNRSECSLNVMADPPRCIHLTVVFVIQIWLRSFEKLGEDIIKEPSFLNVELVNSTRSSINNDDRTVQNTKVVPTVIAANEAYAPCFSNCCVRFCLSETLRPKNKKRVWTRWEHSMHRVSCWPRLH